MPLSEDIAERKRVEEALWDSELIRSRLLADSEDCIKVLDLEGRLLSMNEGGMRALEICELAPHVNSSWIDFWQGTDREAARAAVEKASNGGIGRFIGFFPTTVTKQPRWWDVVVSPIRDAKGKPERLLAISRDVTEHRLNEEALREAHVHVARSEERWRSVFENSAIGVALTDLNGRFLAANPVYQKMVGYTEEELRALSFLDITHEDYREANWAFATELLEGKREQFQIEKQYRRKDGSLVWVRNNVSLVPGTESVPRFIMALSEDITERKRRKRRCTIARRKSDSYSILRLRGSLVAIPRALAFCLTRPPPASWDMTMRLNCSARTCTHWNTTPGKTARRIPSRSAPFTWVFKGTRASIETMRSIGEKTAPAFRWSFGLILLFVMLEPWVP